MSNTQRLPFEQLAGMCACLTLALLAHAGALPPWILALVLGCCALRLVAAKRGGGALSRPALLTLSALAIVFLFLKFHTFNGLAAGTALLALTAGLKVLESKTLRDVYVIALCIFFLSAAALLESESFWLFAYTVTVCGLTSAALLRITTRTDPPGWTRSARYSGRIALQALPLTAVLWLLFPRFSGPLWQLPNDNHSAATGLSDTMTPGDITNLARSDEVAFRVHFANLAPPARERYWRGPVLHEFDGRTWRRNYTPLAPPPELIVQGTEYAYTVNLEPHQHNWIFVLDWPSHWDLPQALLTSDYTLMQSVPVSHPIDVPARSFTQAHSAAAALSEAERRRDTRLPAQRNPRALQLAAKLRREHADDLDLARAVLMMFTQQEFYYTLTPPPLGRESVDEFLFDSRRGFCGHYASAFAVLLRAAGIPTRVVTGYQGGTFNRFADYWIIRQSDAHAWNEIWLQGRGWVRIDPTAAISPQRVENSVDDTVGADEPLAARWQMRSSWLADMRLRLDAMRESWRERILTFNQGSQDELLRRLHIAEPDGSKLAMLLAASLVAALLWLTWQVRRELAPPADAVLRAYRRLCSKLAAAGVPRRPHEGAESFAARVAAERPDLTRQVALLCRDYNTLRYAPPNAANPGAHAGDAHSGAVHPGAAHPGAARRVSAAQFIAAVRAFRPGRPAAGKSFKRRGSRGSS